MRKQQTETIEQHRVDEACAPARKLLLLAQTSIDNAERLPLTSAYDFLLRGIASTNCRLPEACQWLPEPLAALAATIIVDGHRIPQEAFGWEEIPAAYSVNPFIK